MSFTSPDQYRAHSLQRELIETRRELDCVRKSDEVRQLTPINPEGWEGWTGGRTSAGVVVSDQSAMKRSAFWACTRLIASSGGTLPVQVYRTAPDGSQQLVVGAPLANVLGVSPNADQTVVDFWEFVFVSLLVRGNHYARKLKRGDGTLIGLEPMRPDIVSVRRDYATGRILYSWSWEGRSYRDLTDDDVFHIRGFGGGPLGGLSTISYARESLGIAQAADRAAGAMFANGVQPSGVLKFGEFLSPENRAIARGELAEQFAGPQNYGKPRILEGGATWEQISLAADDAQLLESRAWSVEDICRWFGVPPIMIGHSDKTSSWGTGIEQIVLGFQKFTLNPYLVRIEKAIGKQLLTPAERAQGLYAKFNIEGLLRGDSASRAAFYQTMINIGVMTRNEARRKENLPPIEGGDEVMIQSQYVPLLEAIRAALAGPIQAGGSQ